MKCIAVVAPSKGHVEMQELQMEDPGAKEIQVQVYASVISPGTERAWILNMSNTPGKYPLYSGYCSAGVVVKASSDVTRFAPGDRVACYAIGHKSMGNVHEDWAVKMPDGVSYDKAAFMPLGQTALQAVRKTHIELGEKVAVMGLGVIGQFALQLAGLCGAARTIGIDRMDSRLKTASKCGADIVLNNSIPGWMETTQERPNAVLESSGAPDAIGMALEYVRNFGRVVLLGSTRGDSTINFYKYVHAKAVSIIGAHAHAGVPKVESSPGLWTWRDDCQCILDMAARGKLNISPLISNEVDWQDAVRAFEDMLSYKTDAIGTVIKWA